MLGFLIDLMGTLKHWLESVRLQHRWSKLQAAGMLIGSDVCLPASTWIDSEFCYLIEIGDHCGLGEDCVILAHDAQMDEFLDATRVGRVLIHPSSHIGARTTILPGVEIGPRTIVGANSLVSRSLPPDTVCAGVPAKVLCTIDAYLERHRTLLAGSHKFPVATVKSRGMSAAQRAALVSAIAGGSAYIVGGRSEEMRGKGSTSRTR